MRDYEMVRKLAEGSAAEVFLARAAGGSSPVVLEVLRGELTRDSELYGRFLDVAKERQALLHPNILQLTGSGCAEDGRLYVVTEPVGGEHLGSLLFERGRLRPADVIRLMVPLCDAVEYLHAHGIVHGYLRPSHVFLAGGLEDPKPKLLDTGLSLFRSSRSVAAPAARVLVEPEYLCPERIRGQRADARSDVYGLGVLMFELLTGEPPFRSPDPAETRRKHLEDQPPELPPESARLRSVLLRCLAKDPDARYPSAAEVRQALAWYASTPAKGTAHLATDPASTVHLDPPPPVAEAPVSADELVIAQGTDTLLGSYAVEELLGEGGMGQVYRARHVKLGRKVALKVLKEALAHDPTQLRRFFQEARAVNKASHPHIVEIYDFVEEPEQAGGRVYLVMELLEGRTLRALRAAGPLSIRRSVHVVRQVCEALGAAHAVGVVHRDVKPENIFITKREGVLDYVKMLDFGIAKLRAGDSLGNENTRTGVVLGTPAYMAPEQALGEADHRSDIYAAGTVLYALLAGRTPFDSSESTGSLLKRLIKEPPLPLPFQSASGEVIPDGLRDLLVRCLEKEPADRPQTMAEVAGALTPFERSLPVTPARALPKARPASPPSRWRLWLALVIAAACGGAALAWLKPLAPQPPASAPAIEADPAIEVTTPVVKGGAAKKHHR